MKIKLVYIIIGLIILGIVIYLLTRKPKEIIKSKVKVIPSVVTKPVVTPTPEDEPSPEGGG